MKRSEINTAIRKAVTAFTKASWALPPDPLWDVTDFGGGKFAEQGLVLINLADTPEYCEKLMFSQANQTVPLHTHKKKKEDIICRSGRLAIELWGDVSDRCARGSLVSLPRNGKKFSARSGSPFLLEAGERITLFPGIYHAFWGAGEDCVIGEVSTANDDLHDNVFMDSRIGRFPEIVEDEPPLVRLVSEGCV